MLALCLLVFSSAASSTDYKLEYDRRVKNAENIGVLGDDLAGDTVNFNTGALTLRATDVSLPTNALTLSIGRQYEAELDAGDAAVKTPIGSAEQEALSPRMYAFGDWDLDVPYIRTVMGKDSGWIVDSATPTKRCSVVGQANSYGAVSTGLPPKLLGTRSWPFQPANYWNGYTLHAGNSDQSLLVASVPNAQRPSTGGPYHWTTTNNWWVSCLSQLAGPIVNNAAPAGEGYLARSPDGTTYTFNWLSKRIVNSAMDYDEDLMHIKKPAYLFRSEYMMLPTRVEDRFGNWITYTWSNDDFARLLHADAGYAGSTVPVQTVTATSVPGGYITELKVSVAGEADRVWTYTYDGPALVAVTLPDGSQWKYALGLRGRANDYKPTCDLDPMIVDPYYRAWYCWGGGDVPDYELEGTVTHPSGASVHFVMGPNFRMDQFGAIIHPVGLRSKTISGPGIPMATWTFDYLPNKTTAKDACHSGACPSLFATDQLNPDSSIVRKIYSNDTRQQGELLGSIAPNGGGSPILAASSRFGSFLATPTPTTNTIPAWYLERDTRYLVESAATFNVQVGVHPLSYNTAPDPTYLSQRRLPIQTQIQKLQGVTFTSTQTSFDAYGRSTATTEGSIGGAAGDFTRYLTRSYYDDTAKWVVGQLRSNGCTTTPDCSPTREISRTDYDPATALPWKTFRYGQQENEFTYTGGLLTSVKDGRGNSIGLPAWEFGVPKQINFPTGSTLSAAPHRMGWIKSVTDELGSTTSFGYDKLGRLTGITYPTAVPAWTSLQRSVFPSPDAEFGIPAGHWDQAVNTGNGKVTTYYDARFQPVLVLTEDTGNSASKSYVISRFDAMGRQVFRSYPVASLGTVDDVLLGVRTSYDALGRPTRIQQDIEGSSTAATETSYLAGYQTMVTNPRGFATTTRYQLYGEPTSDLPVLIQMPEGVTTSILRQEALGKPKAITRSGIYGGTTLSATRSYVYDAIERLCETIEPESGATVVDYDGNDNVLWSADGQVASGTTAQACDRDRGATAAASKISRSYDAMNRELTRTTVSANENVTTAYYPDGQVKSLTASNPGGNIVTTTYSYNSRRLLTREVLQVNSLVPWTSDYAYDANGHLSSQTYPGNLLVGYAPDGLGRPTQAGSFATGVTYHPNGAIAGFTYGNGIVHSMTQNARQLPARSLDSYISAGVTTKVLDDSYSYDANGNVLSLTDASNAAPSEKRTWGTNDPAHNGGIATQYDGLDRLLKVFNANWGTTTNGYNAVYSYDPLDNLRSNRLGASELTYAYNAKNQLSQLTNALGTSWTVVSDVRGNVTSNAMRTQAYEFDLAHRLGAVTGKESYLYDGNGRRARTLNLATGTIEYFGYSKDGRLMQDWSNRRGVRNGYIYLGGTLVGLYEVTLAGGAIAAKYEHTDGLGSPVATTSASKALLGRMSYTPYGQPAMPMDGAGYTGHFMDVGTQLTYMQQRYYDSQTGRFLSADPISVDRLAAWNFNRFNYAANNPYKFTDPDGRCIWDLCAGETMAAIVVGTVVLATGLYLAKQLSDSIGESTGVYSESKQAPPPSDESSPAAEPAPGTAESDEGVIYVVDGANTQSGLDYVGSTDDKKQRERDTTDGRDRRDAPTVDTYKKGDRAGRQEAEQRAMNQRGGKNKLDNKRNEIRESKWRERNIPPPSN